MLTCAVATPSRSGGEREPQADQRDDGGGEEKQRIRIAHEGKRIRDFEEHQSDGVEDAGGELDSGGSKSRSWGLSLQPW